MKVAPRDVFSEAGMLKLIGQVLLKIEEGKLPNLNFDYKAFNPLKVPIAVDSASEELVLAENYIVTRKSDGEFIELSRARYSKESWCLYARNEEWEEFEVFTDKGEIHQDFLDYLGDGNKQNTPDNVQLTFKCAMLMKCLGKLCLNSIECVDVTLPNIKFNEERFSAADGFKFEIERGELFPVDTFFTLNGDTNLTLGMNLDSKALWPMFVLDMSNDTRTQIFKENGKYTDEFLELLKVPEDHRHLLT